LKLEKDARSSVSTPFPCPPSAFSSTPRSRRSSSTFSHENLNIESATDVDSENTESDQEESDGPESDGEGMGSVTQVLESHLFSVLGSNLAALLIPKIYDYVNKEDSTEFRKFSKTNGDEGSSGKDNSGSTETQQPSEDFSATSSHQDQSSNSRSQKRGRDSGESEGEEEYSNSKKPRRDPGDPDDGPSPESGPLDRLNFACHFHKLDPMKYRAGGSQKYGKCTGSRITELRRIKLVPGSLFLLVV
jgi:hypothetical protein